SRRRPFLDRLLDIESNHPFFFVSVVIFPRLRAESHHPFLDRSFDADSTFPTLAFRAESHHRFPDRSMDINPAGQYGNNRSCQRAGSSQGAAHSVNKVCFEWQAGRCNRHPCRFLHSELPQPMSTHGATSRRGHHQGLARGNSGAAGAPISGWGKDREGRKASDKICSYFIGGNCSYGDKCRFLHSWFIGDSFSLLTSLQGHQNVVHSAHPYFIEFFCKVVTGIALPSESDKLYSGSKDESVRVWDSQTGQCTGVFSVGGEVGCMISEGAWIFIGVPNAVKVSIFKVICPMTPCRCTPRWPVVTRHEQHLFCYMRMFTTAVALDIGFMALHITCWWSCCKPTPDYVCAICFCRKIGMSKFFDLIYSAVLLTNGIFVPRVCLFYVACMMPKPNQSCYVLATTKAFISMTFRRKYTCIYILRYMYVYVYKLISDLRHHMNPVSLSRFSERGKIFSKKEVRAMEVGPSGLFFTGDGTGELKVWKWSTNKMPVS
ncbi:hypothetical protein BHE74_00042678, partial [Ensete ventricosum]